MLPIILTDEPNMLSAYSNVKIRPGVGVKACNFALVVRGQRLLLSVRMAQVIQKIKVRLGYKVRPKTEA